MTVCGYRRMAGQIRPPVCQTVVGPRLKCHCYEGTLSFAVRRFPRSLPGFVGAAAPLEGAVVCGGGAPRAITLIGFGEAKSPGDRAGSMTVPPQKLPNTVLK